MNEKVNPISTNASDNPTFSDRQSNGIVKHRSETYYAQFLSEGARQRKPSAIHVLVPLEHTPGVVSLLAGKPNSGTFPFTELNFTVKDPYRQRSPDIPVTINGGMLSEGLQYTATPGINGLISWFSRLQEREHGREAAAEGWRVSIGCGSRELVGKTIEALVDPGGSVLVDLNTKLHLDRIPSFQTHSCRVVDIPTDSLGILPSGLESILQTWVVRDTNPRPKLLYTVPFGAGPETSRERRLEILRIVSKWDILILEDDPYYYLTPRSKRTECPSYFALEKEEFNSKGDSSEGNEIGHVLRYDTLSTTLGPGLGLGWISGPVTLVGAVDTYSSSANLQAPTVSQAIALALLRAWGHEGFLRYVERSSSV